MGVESLIGGLYAADAQNSAAQTAANAQTYASDQATELQLKMWEQAREDFAPYLNYGYQGISNLSNAIPQYTQSVIAPLYQQYMQYSPSALPDPYAYSVNPVTGEVSQPRTQENTQIQSGAYPAQTTNQGYGNLFAPFSANQNQSSTYGNLFYPSSNTQTNQNNISTRDALMNFHLGTGSKSNLLSSVGNSLSNVLQNTILNTTPNTTPNTTDSSYQYFAPNNVNLLTAYNAPETNISTATQDQLSQGGVLSPTVPEFQRPLEGFNLDTSDPYYQTRLAQKNEEINAFLAKNGLTNSTAGETYRQKMMDTFNADEFDRQYNRALTERNYLTQTDIDKYNLLSGRGDTLYNRLNNQQDTTYNRAHTNTADVNTQNQNLLANRYNMGSNIYNMLYGQYNDAAKYGAGAASSTGQQGISTGNSIAGNYLYSGDAAAQAALTGGQAAASIYNALGNYPSNALSAYNYYSGNNQNNYGNYYGGQNSYYSTPSYNSWNTTTDIYGD